MGKTYPELIEKQELIKKNHLYRRRKIFFETLEKGVERLNKIIETLDNTKVLPGSIAFELYDTYGFL